MKLIFGIYLTPNEYQLRSMFDRRVKLYITYFDRVLPEHVFSVNISVEIGSSLPVYKELKGHTSFL